MSYRKVPTVGQAHENSCWAASLSWWLKAMAGTGRPSWTQSQVQYEFAWGADENGAMRDVAMMNSWADDTRLKMATRIFETPNEELNDLPLGSKPVCIAYKHPSGFAHMNVIWRDGPGFCVAMEPYFPYPGTNGTRKGRFVRREYDWFNRGDRVLLAWGRPFDGAVTNWPEDAG